MKYAKETQRRGIEIDQRCQLGEPRSGRSWRSTVRSSIWAVDPEKSRGEHEKVVPHMELRDMEDARFMGSSKL